MSALVNGFERGFNMMERHDERLGRKDRLDKLDQQNETRYQDSQQRLSETDKRNDSRYNDSQQRLSMLDEKSDERHQDTIDYRNKTIDNTKEYRNWQQKKQENTDVWAKDQQMLGVGWDYFRTNGQIAPEHEEMFQRNKGYDPRTFQNPEMRQKVKALSGKMNEVLQSGEMAKVNSPDTIQLFDDVFQDKIAASVGTYDEQAKSKISAVNFAGFVPTNEKDGSVSFALKVTYENGASTIKPMTEGRSSDKDDPVLQMKPDELIGTIQAKMMMTDMTERPEYWDKMGGSIAENLMKRRSSRGVSQQDRTESEYRKELASINKDLTNAIAKIEGDSSSSIIPEDRTNAIKRVEALFQQRKNELDKAYGVESKAEPEETKPDSDNNSSAPPVSLLSEGKQTKFKNGQVWTLENGKAVKIN